MIKLPLTLCLGLVTKETHDVIGVHSIHYLRASVPFVSRMNMINKFSLFHSGGFNAAVCDFRMLCSLESFSAVYYQILKSFQQKYIRFAIPS